MDNPVNDTRIHKTIIHCKINDYELGELTEIVRNFCGLVGFEVYYGVLKKYIPGTAVLDLVDESTTILVNTSSNLYERFEDHVASRFSRWDIDFDVRD